MSTAVGLNFRVTASVNKFERAMDQINKKLGQVEQQSKSTASGIKLLAGIEIFKIALKSINMVISGFKAAAQSVISFANASRQATDALGKLSDQTGFAVEPLQVLRKLSEEQGISAENLGGALNRMGKRLAEAGQGFGEALKPLQAMGFNIDQLLQKKPEQQFMLISRAIARLPSAGERAAVAFKIFSDQGLALAPMLTDLEDKVADARVEMMALGQILDTTQVENIEEMNNAMGDVYRTAHKLGDQVLANFAPAITDASNALLEMVKNFVGADGATGGRALADSLTKAFFTGAKLLARFVDDFIKAAFEFVTAMTRIFEKIRQLIGYVFDTSGSISPKAQGMDKGIEDTETQLRLATNKRSYLRGEQEIANEKQIQALSASLKGQIEQRQKYEDDYIESLVGSTLGIKNLEEAVVKAEVMFNESITRREKQMQENMSRLDLPSQLKTNTDTLKNNAKGLFDSALKTGAALLDNLGEGAKQATRSVRNFVESQGKQIASGKYTVEQQQLLAEAGKHVAMRMEQAEAQWNLAADQAMEHHKLYSTKSDEALLNTRREEFKAFQAKQFEMLERNMGPLRAMQKKRDAAEATRQSYEQRRERAQLNYGQAGISGDTPELKTQSGLLREISRTLGQERRHIIGIA